MSPALLRFSGWSISHCQGTLPSGGVHQVPAAGVVLDGGVVVGVVVGGGVVVGVVGGGGALVGAVVGGTVEGGTVVAVAASALHVRSSELAALLLTDRDLPAQVT